MSKRDYYEVLGVRRTDTLVEFKKSFRRLAMKYHPDRCPDDPQAQDKFKEIKEAYEVLSDERKRAMYDQYGHAAFEAGAGQTSDFNDVGDIFGDIFGGSRGHSRQGADLRYIMELDLVEAVFGTERKIEIPAQVRCHHCKGTGSADGRMTTCTTCHGHGRVRMQNGIFSIQQTCPQCAGAGKMINKPCTPCHGEGRLEEKRTLSVRIPEGVDNGDRIRLNGQGEAGPGGASPGDLYVQVKVREHEIFQRDGNDLHCELPMRFSQVVLGARLSVPTLDGEVILTIPPETQAGQQFRLRGRGVKSVRSGRIGDLICRVAIETPVNLTGRQRELLEQLETSFAESDAGQHMPRSKTWFEGVKQFWSRVTSSVS